MSTKKAAFTIAMSLAMMLSIAAPAAAGSTAMAESSLSIGVDQGTDTLTVTVTDNGAAAENASVAAYAVNGSTETLVGESVTDANGTATFQTPNASTVRFDVAAGNLTASKTVELGTSEEDDETDESETDENETDGNETDAFGQEVSAFIDGLMSSNNTSTQSEGSIGMLVSQFVHENNPAADKIPDHAGPKNETGKPAHAGPDGDKGKPEHAGKDDDGDNGKPAHAGPDKDKKDKKDKGKPAWAGPGGDDGEDETEDDE